MAGSFDGRMPTRGVEQAIVALKKGAHLLKFGKRGKPKFCPFRLSSDEKTLVWYSKDREKHLSLNSVSTVVLGQKTMNFLRHRWPEKESQSLSLVYKNGECSIDLICRDRDQAECWFLGLTALTSSPYSPLPLAGSKSGRQINSCAISPRSYLQRKCSAMPLSNAVVPEDVPFSQQNGARKFSSDGYTTEAPLAAPPTDSVTEQIEHGVYVTFSTSSCGKKDIKRIRFSRKHFGEKEAQHWWEHNKTRVYDNYKVEQMATPSVTLSCSSTR